jgi:hypothetical protein
MDKAELDRLEKELRERATSYRQGGPSSEHTAAMLDQAADELASLRASLEEAVRVLEPFTYRHAVVAGQIGAPMPSDVLAARQFIEQHKDITNGD